jgi:hypothetical protein
VDGMRTAPGDRQARQRLIACPIDVSVVVFTDLLWPRANYLLLDVLVHVAHRLLVLGRQAVRPDGLHDTITKQGWLMH